LDRDAAGVGEIEQTKNVEQRAFPTARRADNGMDASGLDLQRDTAQRVHAFFFLAEISLDGFAA
jgi:hypothetical protein